MTTSTRIGDLLCAAGELEPNELARLLKLQESSPARPLGALAEEHAGVDPAAVEAAWAAQMSQWGGRVDPRRLYPRKRSEAIGDAAKGATVQHPADFSAGGEVVVLHHSAWFGFRPPVCHQRPWFGFGADAGHAFRAA